MDVGIDNEGPIIRSYKCADTVVSNLNIVYNACSSTITLWNRFQIYVYEDLELNYASKVIVPEFLICDLIMSNNYIVCLDYAGNLYTTPLKFKNDSTQKKRFKSSFQQQESSIITCSLFTEESTISIKLDSDLYYLCVHKINSEFELEKQVLIISDELLPITKKNSKYILKSYPVTETQLESLKSKLSVLDLNLKKKNNLVIISLDRSNVYACVFSAQYVEEAITLVKLYTCPSFISDIDIINIEDINIVIGLQTGTIVSLNFKDDTPKIIHINTSIHKIMVSKDYLIYTDGLTMWKADNIFSNETKFTELFVKNTNDFIKFADQIVCVTFNNLLYTFSLEDEMTYIQVKSVPEYCPVEKLFKNPQWLSNILVLAKDNEKLLKTQKKERDYIMALSVTGRQDVMDAVIRQNVIVYESYEDAITAKTDLILTNNMYEYFDPDSFYFFIYISILKEHKLGDLFSNDIGDLRLHITFFSEDLIIKTNTVNMTDNIDTMNLLIPLKTEFINLIKMKVDVKIITNIPGVYFTKHKMWTVLHSKTVVLSSENFIKFNLNSVKKVTCMKPSKLSLDELILEAAKHQYDTVIDFTKVQTGETRLWSMYVRLPIGYQLAFKDENTRRKFTSKRSLYFLQEFMADEFLQSKSSINLIICDENVKVEIDNDGFSRPCLKVSSQNAKITFDMRNFFSNLIYNIFNDFGPGKQFISHSFYMTVENLQKTLRENINTGSEEDILDLINQFEKKVIGSLPV